MRIYEKIYTNLGKGYSDAFVSEGIDSSFNKSITPLAVHKGSNLRFIYKCINSKYVFIQSVPLENDDFNRGGMYLSHYIIMDDAGDLNPSEYIFSPCFLVRRNDVKNKKDTLKRINKNNKLIINNNKNVVVILDCILSQVVSGSKVIFTTSQDNVFFEDIYSAYALLPEFITKKISFSINIDKFNDNNICDINFVVNREDFSKNYYIKAAKNVTVVDLDKDVLSIPSKYSLFVIKLKEVEKIAYFDFLKKAKGINLENINSSMDSYLINSLGVFKTKTQDDIISTVMSVTKLTSLSRFMSFCLDNNVKIESQILRKIDSIIYNKFYSSSSKDASQYIKWLSIFSSTDCVYYLERYKFLRYECFIALFCEYSFSSNDFIRLLQQYKINNNDVIKFCLKTNQNEKVFFIFRNQIQSMYSKIHHSYYSLDKENKVLGLVDDFLEIIKNEKNEIKSEYLKDLIDIPGRSLNFLIFLVNHYTDVFDEKYKFYIYNLIEESIRLKAPKNDDFLDFIDATDFSKSKGMTKLKREKLNRILSTQEVSESQLDLIIGVLTRR